MPKRSRSGKPDVNEMAADVIDAISGEFATQVPQREKNPAAVALGRLGGLKGGKARAEKLNEQQRKAIAKRAAEARWNRRT